MKFGYFDDTRREYVITTPQTPLPWINYLGSQDFFRLISNTSGGYCFYRDAKLMRLTRYRYNNSPLDSNGHYYYINDGNSVWNPRARQEVLVPLGETCEVTRITLTNTSARDRRIDLYSYVEFCLWDAQDDSTNFQRNFSIGEVEVSGSAIYHKTEYRERRNHYAVFSLNREIAGFDTSRDDFVGLYNGPHNPKAVMAGESYDSIAHGWAPVGSHHLKVSLGPGESASCIFVLGYCENPQDEKFEAPGIINKKPALELISRFSTDEQFDQAMAALKDYWNALLSTFSIRSDDDKLNRLVNIWNQYQCMVTFNMSRSASYYESGLGRGMGFRDSCQDLLGFV